MITFGSVHGDRMADYAHLKQSLGFRFQSGALSLRFFDRFLVEIDHQGPLTRELALAFAIELKGTSGITLLSAGTDGTDGPTDAAGAIVDGETPAKATAKGLDPEDYLNRNDSYSFFKAVGGLLMTGPTGTNVMDIQIILVG